MRTRVILFAILFAASLCVLASGVNVVKGCSLGMQWVQVHVQLCFLADPPPNYQPARFTSLCFVHVLLLLVTELGVDVEQPDGSITPGISTLRRIVSMPFTCLSMPWCKAGPEAPLLLPFLQQLYLLCTFRGAEEMSCSPCVRSMGPTTHLGCYARALAEPRPSPPPASCVPAHCHMPTAFIITQIMQVGEYADAVGPKQVPPCKDCT